MMGLPTTRLTSSRKIANRERFSNASGGGLLFNPLLFAISENVSSSREKLMDSFNPHPLLRKTPQHHKQQRQHS
jgi:hypothetical protein